MKNFTHYLPILSIYYITVIKKTSILFSLACILLVSPTILAQDVILKRDQSELSVKVLEIEENDVKFKYFNRLDGPVYSIKKTDIFVIIYSDGSRETFATTEAQAAPKKAGQVQAEKKPTASVRNTTQKAPQTKPEPQKKDTEDLKRGGWQGGLGYLGSVQSIGKYNGISSSAGYYRLLNKKSTIAAAATLAYHYFLEDYSPSFIPLTIDGYFRPLPKGKLYIGISLGGGLTEVKYAEYRPSGIPVKKSKYYFDPVGSLFLGIGPVRASIFRPSLDVEGELFTVGIYTNPFSAKLFK